MHRLLSSRALSLLVMALVASVPASRALPAPQVVITATVPTDVTLPTIVPSLPSVDIPSPIFTTVPATSTQTSATSTTQPSAGDGSGATASASPSIVVLPGFAGVTRTQPPARASDTFTSTVSFMPTSTPDTSLPMETRTTVITLSDFAPVVTATVTLSDTPPRPTLDQGHGPRHRQPGPVQPLMATTIPGNSGGSGDQSQTQNDASMQVYGQAYIFKPPTDEQGALDPYYGPFKSFSGFNLRQDQEERLLNRSFYFKGQPYTGQVQVQLSANTSTSTTPVSESIAPIRFPVPRPAPLVAWESPDHPAVSRKNTTLGESSEPGSARPGILDLAGIQWFDLPQGFIPRQPVANQLGAVFMPYQVATLQEGEQMSAEPQNANVSYLVLAPEIGSVSGGGTDHGGGSGSVGGVGQDPSQQQPGSGSDGDGQSAAAQAPVLRKHVAVVSEIDDVLKETQLTSPLQSLFNTFTETYEPTPGMPGVMQGTLAQAYANNSTALTFHYITSAPIPLAPSYLQFLQAYYPFGSLTARPTAVYNEQAFVNQLKDGSSYKYAAVGEVLSAFPGAQVVLFAEANSLQTYADLVAEFSTQIACLYLRTATPSSPGQGQGQPGAPQVTQQRAVQAVRQRLSQEMAGLADRVVNVFSNPADLLGLNYTTNPIQCA